MALASTAAPAVALGNRLKLFCISNHGWPADLFLSDNKVEIKRKLFITLLRNTLANKYPIEFYTTYDWLKRYPMSFVEVKKMLGFTNNESLVLFEGGGYYALREKNGSIECVYGCLDYWGYNTLERIRHVGTSIV